VRNANGNKLSKHGHMKNCLEQIIEYLD